MKFKTRWSKESKRQRQISLLSLLIAHHTKQPEDYLNLVSAGSEGIFASTDEKYSYAIFGRDSIEVAEDLLDSHKQLAHDVIMTLASLQGVELNLRREEEPGKIHHEYRSRKFQGRHISSHAAMILDNLQVVWGSTPSRDEMIYYGSYDATPLYIRLVGRYVDKYGDAILDNKYRGRDNDSHTIGASLAAAQQWLVEKISLSPLGLLEYRRLNPRGIENQVWKDSKTAYLHLDGSIANYERGIASVELQGYAYDALMTAAKFSKSETEKRELRDMALHIQKVVIDTFWMGDENYFAEGIDHDARGNNRQIKTICSNGGVLLESGLLRDLGPGASAKFVHGVVAQLFNEQLLTSVGIRSRALKYKKMPGFVDYHGSYTVWPKETYDIAKGLKKFGYFNLAEELEDRILAGVESAGEFYEFFYVDEQDKTYYEKRAVRNFLLRKRSADSPIPQKGQAWVISAVLAIEYGRVKHQKLVNVSEFESGILADMPNHSEAIK